MRRISASGRGDDALDREFWQERGGAEGWRELLAPADRPQILYLLRRCTYAERPFGDEEFLGAMEERLGKKWARWPFEREVVDQEATLSFGALEPAGA